MLTLLDTKLWSKFSSCPTETAPTSHTIAQSELFAPRTLTTLQGLVRGHRSNCMERGSARVTCRSAIQSRCSLFVNNICTSRKQLNYHSANDCIGSTTHTYQRAGPSEAPLQLPVPMIRPRCELRREPRMTHARRAFFMGPRPGKVNIGTRGWCVTELVGPEDMWWRGSGGTFLRF